MTALAQQLRIRDRLGRLDNACAQKRLAGGVTAVPAPGSTTKFRDTIRDRQTAAESKHGLLYSSETGWEDTMGSLSPARQKLEELQCIAIPQLGEQAGRPKALV